MNFKEDTLWNQRKKIFEFNKTYIGEQGDLSFIEDDEFDFLLSSHTLEHSANPLKVIFEFKRIIKKNGF